MLWTIVNMDDVFYSAPKNCFSIRSSNPFDYIQSGYSLDNASLYGGQNNVVFNCDISGHRTGSNLDSSGV